MRFLSGILEKLREKYLFLQINGRFALMKSDNNLKDNHIITRATLGEKLAFESNTVIKSRRELINK